MPGTESHEFQKALGSPGLFAPNRLLRQIVDVSIDLLFPPRCAGCGRVDSIWCDTCQEALETTLFPNHVAPLAPFTGMASTAVHQGIIREAVQGLKYGNAPLLAEFLGKRLNQQLQHMDWTIDMIVPVPLHTTRLITRGYNQAQLLSEQVAQETGKLCSPDAVHRQRNTQSQVTLNAVERQTNMADAFQANPAIVSHQRILVIDDVYTTGATLSACGQAILQAGAQAVYGLTVTVARL
ncbi:MAG: ComF family protein [Chloroflexota bacterium]